MKDRLWNQRKSPKTTIKHYQHKNSICTFILLYVYFNGAAIMLKGTIHTNSVVWRNFNLLYIHYRALLIHIRYYGQK